MTTHYEGCWSDPGHFSCAVKEVKRLMVEVEDLRRALRECREALAVARKRADYAEEGISALRKAISKARAA